jgi:hypothetical protein
LKPWLSAPYFARPDHARQAVATDHWAGRRGTGERGRQRILFEQDPGETRNVQAAHPDIVAELIERIDKYITQGRSTAGAPQENDLPIVRQTRH